MSIAKFIDHTILKQTTTIIDIEKLCNEAGEYGFAAVCVPPTYVSLAKAALANTAVKVATVIGFPFGYHPIGTKVTEAQQAVTDGADELDMVMNIGALKNSDFEILKNEIEAITAVTKPNKVLLKVIIESGILAKEEIIACCHLYKNYAVDFLKTSTGYAERGASVEAVQLMRKHLPSTIQIKGSGGIKTLDFAQQLLSAGATRLGCSASVALVNNEISADNY